MARSRSGAHRRDALEDLAEGLRADADAFEPSVAGDSHSLPGRRRGASLESQPVPAVGPAALIIDCGTSRQDGFSHVLWVSPSIEAALGSHVAERLADAMGTVDGVTGYEWEGIDRLHLRAPGRDHGELLREARAVVERLAAR